MFLITAGSILAAISINGILVPQGFLSGGIVGVAIMIFRFFPEIEVGWIYLFLNIPIYVIAWLYVGKRFFLYSIVGLITFSFFTSLIHPSIVIEEKILAAVLAGIVSGTGGGIILKSLGSAGGLDILSVFLMQRFSLRIGHSVLVFNSLLLFAAAFLFSLEAALYTLIFMYVNAKVLNIVITGLNQRKSALIISSQWKEIAAQIKSEGKVGVTLIKGEGGFSGVEGKILYTVFTFRDLPQLKQMVKKTDPNALMVINETLEVMGKNIGNQPHW